MRKLLLALPVLMLLAGSSCKKVDELTEFDLNYSTKQMVPGSGQNVDASVDFTSPDIETQSSSKFSANGTSKDLIDEIKVTAFTITNESGKLDFLNSFSVYMKADGLNEVLIATKSSIPKGITSVSADMTGANIKQHIFKDKIQLRMTLGLDSLPAEDQQLKLDQTLRVKGKKLSKK
jgi:hypothetical protein